MIEHFQCQYCGHSLSGPGQCPYCGGTTSRVFGKNEGSVEKAIRINHVLIKGMSYSFTANTKEEIWADSLPHFDSNKVSGEASEDTSENSGRYGSAIMVLAPIMSLWMIVTFHWLTNANKREEAYAGEHLVLGLIFPAMVGLALFYLGWCRHKAEAPFAQDDIVGNTKTPMSLSRRLFYVLIFIVASLFIMTIWFHERHNEVLQETNFSIQQCVQTHGQWIEGLCYHNSPYLR
ncbi:hypothetical protein D2T29_12655 [Sinirhodobacter populi]|uniref:Uncharacterized protein n=1 Tax=Paenirhodobacter populi TaxID=2306993 RepID=A0A443KCQ3_9RHOB|nr:hypothetical protein [Sinirhodobacter populi]RWR30515.1 hypothetical protein D2T29_12655 [Sinirhodobacter populi]